MWMSRSMPKMFLRNSATRSLRGLSPRALKPVRNIPACYWSASIRNFAHAVTRRSVCVTTSTMCWGESCEAPEAVLPPYECNHSRHDPGIVFLAAYEASRIGETVPTRSEFNQPHCQRPDVESLKCANPNI